MINKILLSILLLVLSSCSTTSTDLLTVKVISPGSAFSTNWADLNPTESDRILAAMDDKCGEYWCTGGWVYHFRYGGRIVCKFSESTCYLSAKVYADNNRTVFRSCSIGNVHRFRDILDGSKLTASFANKAVNCIERWESKGFNNRF